MDGYPDAVQEFVNEPTPVSELPQLGDENFVGVDPNYLRVSLYSMALTAFATVIAAVVLAIWAPMSTWIPFAGMGVVLALLGLAAVSRTYEVRNIAYQVRTHDLSYRSGVLTKRVSTVPFVRVQHARLRQGPIQRRFGLASLEVNSAGPDLHIHGLTDCTAERLKALVVERAGDLVED